MKGYPKTIKNFSGLALPCIILALTVLISACSPTRQLNKKLTELEQTYKYHLGVSVYDFDEKRKIVEWQDDRHFNPASNTKIYTLYACLHAMKDSLPGLAYRIVGDSLYFTGTGDPSFLHPEIPRSRVFEFLRNTDKYLVYHSVAGVDERYGPGWAWDDYNDYYQAEKSPFPLYGNVVRFTGNRGSIIQTDPAFWNTALENNGTKPGIVRDEFANVFRFRGSPLPPELRQDIPIKISDQVTVKLLNYSLGKEVLLKKDIIPGPVMTMFSVPADTVYKLMMYDSDNMIAEHLLYSYATMNGLPLNTKKSIQHALENVFVGMPDSLVWRDGSGLSRYNLFTPRTTVEVLKRMLQQYPREKVFSYFPTGGQTGTIRYLFKESPLVVHAKSGSFSNNYCLSGYLYSKKGKLLIFSIMHNNFAYPIRDMQRVTEGIVRVLYEKF